MTSLDIQADPAGRAAKRASGSSFYAAMRIMPPGQRDAMFEIYSFCRLVDDIADDVKGLRADRLRALAKWREDIDAVYARTAPNELTGLATAVRQFDLDRADFVAIVDGMEMDVLADIQAPDLATLDLYCDRVASAVGRLSGRVFGLEHRDSLLLAEHLGRALQLTNILRDLDEDEAMNRLYLPREWLLDAGIAETAPSTVLAHPRLGVVCERVIDKARAHFVEADAIMGRYPRKTVRTPRVMSEAYKSILGGLVSRGFASPRKRVSLSKSRLGYILFRHVLL